MKRLTLKLFTVRVLDGAELEQVVGGMATDAPQTPPIPPPRIPSAYLGCWPEPEPTKPT